MAPWRGHEDTAEFFEHLASEIRRVAAACGSNDNMTKVVKELKSLQGVNASSKEWDVALDDAVLEIEHER